jgi:hypothetical protein
MQKLEEKFFAPAEDWTLIVQTILRHYTELTWLPVSGFA